MDAAGPFDDDQRLDHVDEKGEVVVFQFLAAERGHLRERRVREEPRGDRLQGAFDVVAYVRPDRC